MPRRAILITGFNNWGKSTHISMLFDGRKRFSDGPHSSSDTRIHSSFTVESRSNDDVGQQQFIDRVQQRLTNAPSQITDLLCAFCPTREIANDSLQILQSTPFSVFDEIHVILLKYKWDWQAELRITEIQTYLQADKRVKFTIVDADAQHTTDLARLNARDDQIRTYLYGVYP